MKRPDVIPENFEDIADFYRSHRPGRYPRRTIYGALATVFSPEIHYATGAQESIEKYLADERTLALVSNHVSNADSCNLAAMVTREAGLRAIAKKCFIMAKPNVFRVKGPGIHALSRYIVDSAGAIPVFRHKDLDRMGVEPELRRIIIDSCLETGTALLNAGVHAAIFNEGGRNRDDPTKLKEAASGIGRMICKVTEREQPALVPIGIWYGPNNASRNIVDRILAAHAPTIVVGAPSASEFATAADATEWLRYENQAALDLAMEIGTIH